MEQIINDFKSWLEILNYSPSAITSRPRLLQEFFEWQQRQNINDITQNLLNRWFAYLSQRNLSLHSLKTYRNALVLYSNFLRETQHESFDIPVSIKGKSPNQKQILTLKEIESLYKATEEYPDPGIKDNGLLAMRERVLLGVFYGCGVRANEGEHVQVEDVLLQRSLLYIRKGKGYKERYVPIAVKVKQDIEDYLKYARLVLLRKRNHNALFIGWYGSPMKKNAIYERLQILKDIARIE
jgi:site-specific recombinase XerD